MYHDGLSVPDAFEIVDFPGGSYAVACDVDGESNGAAMRAINQFIQGKVRFARNADRTELGSVITSPAAHEALGYSQMDYYVPIKAI